MRPIALHLAPFALSGAQANPTGAFDHTEVLVALHGSATRQDALRQKHAGRVEPAGVDVTAKIGEALEAK